MFTALLLLMPAALVVGVLCNLAYGDFGPEGKL